VVNPLSLANAGTLMLTSGTVSGKIYLIRQQVPAGQTSFRKELPEAATKEDISALFNESMIFH
jgi:hypothetical protein